VYLLDAVTFCFAQNSKAQVLTAAYLEASNSNYLLTYLLTPWCRTLFQNVIVTQLVKIYPAFFMESYGSLPCS
jgi:hypothetical protein